MTFITGSITDAAPGPALYAAIETAALAGGWTLADTVVIGATTHKVLKSAAAGNAQGLDWYLDINYPTTGVTGGIRFAAFEGYNSTTKVGIGGPYVANDTTIDQTAFSRYGSTGFALETNWVNGPSMTGTSNTLSTSTFMYWITITRERIIVMLSTQSSSIHYAGLYAPTAAHATHAGAALFPLVTARLTVASEASTAASVSSFAPTIASMAFTRVPRVPSGGMNWGSSCSAWAGPAVVGIFGSGVIGASGLSPSSITGETTITPVALLAGAASYSSVPTTARAFIGTLRDVGGAAVVSTAVRGDGVTVGSDAWYMSTHVSQHAILFRAV